MNPSAANLKYRCAFIFSQTAWTRVPSIFIMFYFYLVYVRHFPNTQLLFLVLLAPPYAQLPRQPLSSPNVSASTESTCNVTTICYFWSYHTYYFWIFVKSWL